MIILKSRAELEIMRRGGRIVARVLAELRSRVRPGVETRELDAFAELAFSSSADGSRFPHA